MAPPARWQHPQCSLTAKPHDSPRTVPESHPSHQRLLHVTYSLSHPASPRKPRACRGEEGEERTPAGRTSPFGQELTPGGRSIKKRLHVTIIFFFFPVEGKGKQHQTRSRLFSLMWLPEAFTLHHLLCINQLPEY